MMVIKLVIINISTTLKRSVFQRGFQAYHCQGKVKVSRVTLKNETKTKSVQQNSQEMSTIGMYIPPSVDTKCHKLEYIINLLNNCAAII